MKDELTNRNNVRTVTKSFALLIVAALVVRPAEAATIAEWLFDHVPVPLGPESLVYNEVAGGDQPSMLNFSNPAYTNWQVAGGPFSTSGPFSNSVPHGIGMMSTPNSGNYSAYKDPATGVNWTTKTNLTIEMWVNPSVYDAAAVPIIYRGQGLELIQNGSGYYLAGILFDGSSYHVTSLVPNNVFTGVWTHIAMTYDGSTLQTYVNGTAQASLSFAAPLGNDPTLTRLVISDYGPSGPTFHGSIDEIRVSDVALIPGTGTGKNGELAWNATLVPEPSILAFLSTWLGLLFMRHKTRSK
jgi:hypothetical protein